MENNRFSPPEFAQVDSPPSRGSAPRWAYCKTNAGTGNTIQAFLDADATGQEVTVICTIAKGSNLNLAFPRLTDGLEIPVVQKGSQWKCLWGFAAAAEDC